MATPVLICDDSSFARKQMARALPPNWDVEVTFAASGIEALDAIKAGKGDILFLDLNMPLMDGYEVLEKIRQADLPTMVIVVSGDVQPEAYQRVTSLGALDFVKKPTSPEKILEILDKFGIRSEFSQEQREINVEVSAHDCYQEIANVAMGRAADLLARLLGEFVVMPIPNVNMLEASELRMALKGVAEGKAACAVGQGFIGGGIAGEALLMFNEAGLADIARLMKYDGELNQTMGIELTMDIGSVLIGACLKGIADQLDISFSQGVPVVLGHHLDVGHLISQKRWNKTLAIEMGYTIENRNISCDLLLLFTEDSIEHLNELVSYIAE